MNRAILITLLAACGDDAGHSGTADAALPTCESVTHELYARGCTVPDLTTGQPISEQEALGRCEYDHFACDLEWQANLDCRATLTTCDSSACDSSAQALINCVRNGP